MRVNGLLGWIGENDRRSLQLFGVFVLAFHLLALPTLFFPLAVFDQGHAPFYDWPGYAARYLVPLTLAAAVIFACLTWWHLQQVGRKLPFRYVAKPTEPRLCRIAEPLVIAAGLPEPRLAVIDTPALNAFAYGFGRKATLVVTRGLIDNLDDDELAAVVAHELTHVKNGDVRFMAAANAFMGCLRLLDRANTVGQVTKDNAQGKSPWKAYGIWTPVFVAPAAIRLLLAGRALDRANIMLASIEVRDFIAWALIALFLPFLLLPILTVLLLRQQALNLGHLVRLLIASSREFIADAGAVALTRNPSALVSALQRIDGRSGFGDVPHAYHAMMIDGESAGELATHPSVGERIAAIVKLTGSMAFIAPARRDTRDPGAKDFGRRVAPTVDLATVERVRPSHWRAWRRIVAGERRNPFGQTRPAMIGIGIGLFALVTANSALIAQPLSLAEKFDPRPGQGIVTLFRVNAYCTFGLGDRLGPKACQMSSMAKALEQDGGRDTVIGKFARSLDRSVRDQRASGTFEMAGGGMSNVPPEDVQAQEALARKCFNERGLTYGNDRTYGLDSGPSDEIRIGRYLESATYAPKLVGTGSGAALDKELLDYLEQRKLLTNLGDRFWGAPGRAAMQRTYATREHDNVVGQIADRLNDPAFSAKLTSLQAAEMRALVASPQDFVSCAVRYRAIRERNLDVSRY